MRRESWHLTEGLLFLHFAVWFLVRTEPQAFDALALIPGRVAGRPWTLITHQFISTGTFWFFISMLVLWIMARPLEESWGSPRFLLFWLVSTFGSSLTATALGIRLVGNVGFGASLLFTFATLFPDVEFRLFFVFPVKVKYLAVISAALLVYSSLSFGLLAGAANIAGTSAGYLFFLATRNLPTRRKIAFELKKRRAAAVARSEDVTAETRNLAWDPKLREAESRARELGRVADEDEPLLAELDAARDSSITVCAPSEFGYVEDEVCRSCPGFAECAARRIRMAADG